MPTVCRSLFLKASNLVGCGQGHIIYCQPAVFGNAKIDWKRLYQVGCIDLDMLPFHCYL